MALRVKIFIYKTTFLFINKNYSHLSCMGLIISVAFKARNSAWKAGCNVAKRDGARLERRDCKGKRNVENSQIGLQYQTISVRWIRIMILYKKKYTKIYFRALFVGFVSAQLMQVRFHHIHERKRLWLLPNYIVLHFIKLKCIYLLKSTWKHEAWFSLNYMDQNKHKNQPDSNIFS